MFYEILAIYVLAATLVYFLAKTLNKKFFNVRPVGKLKAALISFLIFIILTIYFSATAYLRYVSLGLPIKNPFDLSGISLTIFFYWMLVKVKTNFDVVTEKGGYVASFDSNAAAEGYLANNVDKKYKIEQLHFPSLLDDGII